jgi:hypothetical protein
MKEVLSAAQVETKVLELPRRASMTGQSAQKMQMRMLDLVAVSTALLIVLIAFAAPAIAQNAVPFTNQPLVPDAIAPGGAGFTLTVNGTGFVSTSVVNWNGKPRATTYVSNHQLTAAILSSDITTASTAAVTVVSPSPGGGTSSPVFFPIHIPSAVAAFSTADYGVEASPLRASTGDFNGDGNVDLAVSDNGGAAVSILLGNGDGTFQSPTEYAIDGYPVSAVVGDFNGNGKLDLAVPYNISGKGGLAILLGNGNGTFQSGASYTTACDATTTGITADFNRDGNLDLLILGGGCGNTISVWLGNGNGTFQPPVNYTVGVAAIEAAAGDFNGDGFLDIAVANAASSTVSVLLGNGDGTFQPAVSYATPSGPQGVSIADLNGDGKLDLIIPNSTSVSVLLGNGDGTFAGHIDYPVAGGCLRSRVGDFNEDGKLDVVVTTPAPAVELLLGNGDGSFQPAFSVPTTGVPIGPEDVVVADFNRDGRLDVAIPGAGVWTTAVMLQAAPVQNLSTSTTLASSVNPSVYGQAITVTAQVTASSGTPTGVVLFSGSPYQFNPGFLTNGQTAEGLSPAIGTYSITAAYQGITGFNPSTSAALIQVVNKGSTTTSLTSSPNPALIKQSVTLSATVTPQFGAYYPTGSVTFYSGQQSLGTATLSSGRATLTTSFASTGTYSITAQYAGDPNFYGSTSPSLSEEILASTTTTLASSLNPSIFGQAVTFTATVTSSYGTPPNGETVTFKQGSTVLGTATLSSGSASFSTSTLAVGTKSVTAVYAGDSYFDTSTSKAVSQVVDKATTTTALVSSQNPSGYNQSVTLTATVTPQFGGTPSGNLTFKNGTTTLKIATVTGGVATYTTTTLAVGTESITAEYNGNGSFLTSTSGTLNQVVNPATTTTTLVSSVNPSNSGQSVTFTATLVSQFGGPSVKGTVTFMDGTTFLNTVTLDTGKARYTTSTLASGTHNITATYNGGTDWDTSSAALTQTVD